MVCRMRATFSILAAAALVLSLAQQAIPQADTAQQNRALINTYCVGCHNQKAKVGDLVLENLSLDQVGEHGDIWEKVIRKLNGGQMPPQGMPKPPAAGVQTLTQYLSVSLDRAAAAKADPGRAPLHRLNRTEYANAIRDLLAVEIDPAEYLPPHGESDGLDNI